MENTIDLNMSFDFDAAQFDGASLRNLVHMIYSREALLNKSTGGCFHVAPTLINLLSTCVELDTMEDFLQVLVAHDAVYGAGLTGIEITQQVVRISGFGEAPDIRTLKAYGQLAVLMATRSRELRYVYARHIPVTNELFTFRAWLVTLGIPHYRNDLQARLGTHLPHYQHARCNSACAQAYIYHDGSGAPGHQDVADHCWSLGYQHHHEQVCTRQRG